MKFILFSPSQCTCMCFGMEFREVFSLHREFQMRSEKCIKIGWYFFHSSVHHLIVISLLESFASVR